MGKAEVVRIDHIYPGGYINLVEVRGRIYSSTHFYSVGDLAVEIIEAVIPQWCLDRYGLSSADAAVGKEGILLPLIPCEIFVPRWKFIGSDYIEHRVSLGDNLSNIIW